ncbi:hypothetical protein ABEO76_21995 [Bacillus anthracis]|uniref:hypothetical protein n=1 Tax=Bacillus anthracis TaxID=1392 RepID=UPI003D1DD4A7
MTKEIVRENEHIYITELTVKDGVQWYNARMKGLSFSKVGSDLNELENDFTAEVVKLKARFNK